MADARVGDIDQDVAGTDIAALDRGGLERLAGTGGDAR
jgi:hypothetical protein